MTIPPPSSAGQQRRIRFGPDQVRGSMALARGFTLVELLVVIAIIALLAGLLLPVLSRAKNKGVMLVDINNLRQQGLALQLHTSDHADRLPWSNWLAGDVDSNGVARSGWLYTLNPHASGPARFAAATGEFWSYLHSPKLYLCPLDDPLAPLFALRGQQISSYAMNGGVNGYQRSLYPPLRAASLAPEAVSFWETDEQNPGYFNDGANYPAEGVSARHLQGAVNARFDGSAGFIRFDTWYDAVDQTHRNELWCYPDSPDGR